jgi:hypothetical protein
MIVDTFRAIVETESRSCRRSHDPASRQVG